MNINGVYILLSILLASLGVIATVGWFLGDDDRPADIDLDITVNSSAGVIRIAEVTTGYINILPVEVKEKIDAGEDFTILDVRTSEQYAVGHLPGAVSMPISTLSWAMNRLDKTKEVVVYCQYGITSISVCNILIAAGFTDVKNMTGGISAWPYEVVAEGAGVISL